MTTRLDATFGTRREAELVVERLVQEFGLDRKTIHVGPEGPENSAGDRRSGGDEKAAEPSVEPRTDAPLEGRILVSVEPGPDLDAEAVRSAFNEMGGQPPE
jgi:hypothetical protein